VILRGAMGEDHATHGTAQALATLIP
jgi:hypothetical protein